MSSAVAAKIIDFAFENTPPAEDAQLQSPGAKVAFDQTVEIVEAAPRG